MKPYVSNLRIFGCVAYALISQSHHKLDEKFGKCFYLGYNPQSKAYRLYNPLNNKIIISIKVVFNKDATWDLGKCSNKF